MRILITGQWGFVGAAFARYFAPFRHTMDCVDLHDPFGQDCRELFRNSITRYDLVIHCAAVVGGRQMIDGQPLHVAAEDLSIDAELFRWALRTRPGRIVYFSSSAVYPTWLQREGQQMRLAESWVGHGLADDITRWMDQPAIGQPDQTYGWVKLTGERLAAEANAAGIPTFVFRPFSGYGPRQSLDYPFPQFIRRAIEHSDPFDIWGPGDAARDWIHVDDIVGAVVAALDQDVRGPVNLCTGVATTFDDLARQIIVARDYSAMLRHLDDRPTGVHWRVGDPTRMREFYKPKVDLSEGIARALKEAR